MCVTYFFKRSHCRIPTSTQMKPVAMAGQAFGQWHKRSHSFVFRLPPGVCKANATFTGTTDIHGFQFKAGFCQAIYIPWEDVDYDYQHDYYLLARERSRLGQGDFRTTDHSFQRRPSITDFYNPTCPAYLVWRDVTHCRRRYDPEEYQSPDNRYYCPPHTTSTLVPHTQHLDPGENIPLPGIGVEALNLEDLPLPRCQHHLAHLHLPTLHQWLITCPPIIKGAPHFQIKDKGFTINP